MLHAFIYGVVLAFGLILPLGVQNVFIFNQGATQRHFSHAMPSVITASICDSFLILSAILGVSVAALTIPWFKTILFTIGFFFLSYMGWVTWHNKPPRADEGAIPFSAKKQVAFAVSVSILNPHAVIDSVGVIGTNSLNFIGSERVCYAIACLLVSCVWFFGLSVAGHFLHRLDKSGVILLYVNKFSALIIWSVAIYLACQLIF